MSPDEITQEFFEHLSKNLSTNIEGRLKAFDRLANKVFSRWYSEITYSQYIGYVCDEMAQGLFTIERSQKLLDTSENNPDNFFLAFDLHARHAIAHRLNSQRFYESKEHEKSDSALQCATFHLGAVHVSKSTSVVQRAKRSQKSKKGGEATSLNFKTSAREFAKLIRERAPESGWPSKKSVYYDLNQSMIEYETNILKIVHKNESKNNITARLKRWLEQEDDVIKAYTEKSSKSARRTLKKNA